MACHCFGAMPLSQSMLVYLQWNCKQIRKIFTYENYFEKMMPILSWLRWVNVMSDLVVYPRGYLKFNISNIEVTGYGVNFLNFAGWIHLRLRKMQNFIVYISLSSRSHNKETQCWSHLSFSSHFYFCISRFLENWLLLNLNHLMFWSADHTNYCICTSTGAISPE